jgi:prepilin-type N-terminal cleavage/methylation domain-containing protein
MNRKNTHSQDGFTLIELLVVIAIIALMSSIVLTGTNIARASGRDSARVSDMVQFRNAVALYQLDHNGIPPCPAPAVCTNISSPTFSTAVNGLLAGGYIAKIPTDPKNTSQYTYYYQTDAVGTNGFASAGVVWFTPEAKGVGTSTEGLSVGNSGFTPTIIIDYPIGSAITSNP